MKLQRSDLDELHCIVPMANLPSIIEIGILCHARAERVQHVSVAAQEIQDIRAGKVVPNGRPLHDYANLYIDARNPMMFRVIKERGHHKLSVLRVSTDVLDLPNVVITDGNAAGGMTRFGPAPQGLAMIDQKLVFAEWWNGSHEAKRCRCAEVLVPDRVPPEFVTGAYVSCEEARQRFEGLNWTARRIEATISEHMFYE